MTTIRKRIIDFIISHKFLFTSVVIGRYFFNSKKVKKIRQQNIMMLHAGRTGSSVVGNLLNQHTDIKWDGEIYIDYPKYLKSFTSDPIKFLRYKTYQKPTKIYGFEIKALEYQHLEMFIGKELSVYLEEIRKLGYEKFIFLKRKNLLHRYISIIQMLNSGVLHVNKEQTRPKKIKIKVDNIWDNGQKMNLVEYLSIFEKRYELVLDKLKKYDILILTYEDDIKKDPLIAYKKVCNFLDIETQNPKIKLKRTNPFTIKEIVENYDELEQSLENTEFKWMLETEQIKE